jgi:predicted nuclease of predicted toxin-antitoxin system
LKILLDENLPRRLVAALRGEGHENESVHNLHLQGLENGKLHEFARQSFDLCFTRDAAFANQIRHSAPGSLKLLRVTLAQKPQDEFIGDFIAASEQVIGVISSWRGLAIILFAEFFKTAGDRHFINDSIQPSGHNFRVSIPQISPLIW